MDKDPITLGSGKLYFEEYTDQEINFEMVKALCVDEKRLGLIKSGAALSYTETTHVEKDDLNLKEKVITTDEEVKLKCGLITWTGNTLNVLIDRSKVTTENGVRVTKIGGTGNKKGKYYILVFHHEDAERGDLYTCIVGRNTAGVTLNFTNDNATKPEPEFAAKPHDKDGTRVVIYEVIPATANAGEQADAGEQANAETGE